MALTLPELSGTAKGQPSSTKCADWCVAPVHAHVQVLPFRASIAHHDAHHKYSNHHSNAKNYGETFWVWDALFGTSSPLSGCAQAKAK